MLAVYSVDLFLPRSFSNSQQQTAEAEQSRSEEHLVTGHQISLPYWRTPSVYPSDEITRRRLAAPRHRPNVVIRARRRRRLPGRPRAQPRAGQGHQALFMAQALRARRRLQVGARPPLRRPAAASGLSPRLPLSRASRRPPPTPPSARSSSRSTRPPRRWPSPRSSASRVSSPSASSSATSSPPTPPLRPRPPRSPSSSPRCSPAARSAATTRSSSPCCACLWPSRGARPSPSAGTASVRWSRRATTCTSGAPAAEPALR